MLYRHLTRDWRKLLLLFASYLFYSFWDWRFLPLIVFSTALDYFVGKSLIKAIDQRRRKWLLVMSITGNLLPLIFFKYYTFLTDNFSQIVGYTLGWQLHRIDIDVILPVGISFYTFQTLSYSIDLYKRKATRADSIIDFALYVTFFPQLVAGPIEKSRDLLPQLKKIGPWRAVNVKYGLLTFMYGLTLKVVIADSAAWWVDELFMRAVPSSGLESLIAAILFAIQIYLDFSGYTLMAKGLAHCFGIKLSDNFRQPYLSVNITEFWRRWHITLSSWLKEYVYIPLGGNRKGKFRQYMNLIVTMLIGGMWHGASWNFIIWGGIHGFLLVFHKLFASYFRFIPSWLGTLLTFFSVTIAWIFFRANSFDQAIAFVTAIFSSWNSGISNDLAQALLLCLGATLFVDLQQRKFNSHLFFRKWPAGLQYAFLFACWGTLLILMLPNKPEAFIYFQF